MSKKQYPPFDFKCQYKNNCPHLEYLSTQWVWEEYQRSHDEYQEHWRVRNNINEELEKALKYIGELEKENAELKAKFQALHRKQFKKNKENQQEASTDNLNSDKKKKKKRGAPKGHPGWQRRKPDHIR